VETLWKEFCAEMLARKIDLAILLGFMRIYALSY
jgi:hypothetical protein